MLAYRQEAHVAAAIAGAFAQTWPPLEILLSDDASPDGTYRVMQAMAAAYAGPHRVVLNRNEQNLGLIGHLNRVMALASGDFVVQNAGDDVSAPGPRRGAGRRLGRRPGRAGRAFGGAPARRRRRRDALAAAAAADGRRHRRPR